MQTILGKYEIRETISSGAMSTVFDGWDRTIDRRVAIKAVPLAETGQSDAVQSLIRFRREAQAAGRLQHPAVVGIFDYGESAGHAFIVMEFVDGGTLKAALEGGTRFSIGEINRLMQDILAGLQYSHGQGVIHRDVKPANIMLTRDGRAKLTDFGIARIEHSDITQIGTVMGTPAYMSPEQFRGETISASTDVYSAGVILYQLLTGERPFDGGLATIMHKALSTTPPKPSAVSGTVPHAADAVVARAMAKRPDERYRTAADFARACQDALVAGSLQSATPSLRRVSARVSEPGATTRSRKRLIAGAFLAVLLAAGGAVAYRMNTTHGGSSSTQQSQQADGKSPGLNAAQVIPAPPKPALPPNDIVAVIHTQAATPGDPTPATPAGPDLTPATTPSPVPVERPKMTVAEPRPDSSSTPLPSLPLAAPQEPDPTDITKTLLTPLPKRPSVIRKPRPTPPRPSVARQPAGPKTNNVLPFPVPPMPGQPDGSPAGKSPQTVESAPTSSETPASTPVTPPPESAPAPRRYFGNLNVTKDGRRVFESPDHP